MNFQQYQMVRVIKLNHEADYYDGWKFNARAPAVGEVGAIVEILQAQNAPNGYVVECVAEDGFTIWLGAFSEDELADL